MLAVVTGARRGLGFETCRRLACEGMTVVLTARSLDRATDAVEMLRGEGLDVHAEALDVGSDDSVEGFFGRVEKLGNISVLVNNAGTIFEGQSTPTLQVSPATIAQAFENNALGAWRTMRAALPQMNAAGYGRIVNVSSGMGGLAEMGGGWPAYRVSKTAMNAFTRLGHLEAGPNVKVNAVCPGWVRTDMGGAGADRSIDEGVAGILWAATLPDDGPSGGFFRDGKSIAW